MNTDVRRSKRRRQHEQHNQQRAVSPCCLPNVLENVEVLWELPTGNVVWWRAVVEEVSASQVKESIGRGTISYDAEHGHAAEVCKVIFLQGSLLTEERTPEDQSDFPQMSWRFLSHSEQTDAPARHGIGYSTSNASDEIAAVQQASALEVTDGPNGEVLNSNSSETRESIEALRREQHHLHSRFLSIERTLVSKRDQNAQDGNTARLAAFKAQLRHDVLLLLQDRPRKRSGKGDSSFAECMYRQTMMKAYACDLDFFSSITTELISTPNVFDNHIFHPSPMSILHPSHAASKLTVIFKDLKAFCNWLQIRDPGDRERMLMRSVEGRDFNALRVLGGLQHDPSDDKKPISMYFGRSCMKLHSSTASASSVRNSVRVLQRSSAEWDAVNRRFKRPIQLIEESDILQIAPDEVCTDVVDAIMLVWQPLPNISTRLWSKDAASSKGFVLGSASAFMPSVVFVGHGSCDKIGALLREDEKSAIM